MMLFVMHITSNKLDIPKELILINKLQFDNNFLFFNQIDYGYLNQSEFFMGRSLLAKLSNDNINFNYTTVKPIEVSIVKIIL